MPYTTLEKLNTKMPLVHIREALSDDDVELDDEPLEVKLAAVIETVSDEIDALVGGRFKVPFSDPPAKIRNAALILTLESLHGNRVQDDKNPWVKKANAVRKQLEALGLGDEPLTPELDNSSASEPSGFAIQNDNPAVATSGRMAT